MRHALFIFSRGVALCVSTGSTMRRFSGFSVSNNGYGTTISFRDSFNDDDTDEPTEYTEDGITVTESHAVVKGRRCTVLGSHCKVKGDGCRVLGSHCTVDGDECTVIGSHCTVNGRRCVLIDSDHTTVNGADCSGTGRHCRINGSGFKRGDAEAAASSSSSADRERDRAPVRRSTTRFNFLGGATVVASLDDVVAALPAAKPRKPAAPRCPPEGELVVAKEGTDARVCVICLTHVANRLIRRCNHMCLCGRCAVELMRVGGDSPKCPECRAAIECIERVF